MSIARHQSCAERQRKFGKLQSIAIEARAIGEPTLPLGLLVAAFGVAALTIAIIILGALR